MSENGDTSRLGHLVTLHTTLFTKLNQEGDGIWSRFNILVAINLALFAGFGAIRLSKEAHGEWWPVLCGLCAVGFVLSLWSWQVLQRLWIWSDYWGDELRNIEKDAAWNLPKPMTNSEKNKRLYPNGKKLPSQLLRMESVFLVFAFVWTGMAIWNCWSKS